MFFLRARFPLQLDREGWEGVPSLGFAGFVVEELDGS